ncbi:caspase family protein [Streptomyces massasporeus]|uniref:HD domain-containing protein n=1 Tax=Streptomyces massasporeus TaxID=67324 RepID=UPI0036BDD440
MRRALLIGVSATPLLDQAPELADEYRPLPCATRDVAMVAKALDASDYAVKEYHADLGPELLLGKSSLQGALENFFEECDPDDTALVYVSCHGVTIDERDYLLPADARYARAHVDGPAALAVGSLIAADQGGLKMQGLQRGVNAVVFLDICRTEAPHSVEWTTTAASPLRDVVWVYSCGQGQRSYADPELGSWFGRALAEALDPNQPPTTLTEVVRHAELRMQTFSEGHDVDPPSVEVLATHGKVPGSLELCRGLPEQLPWAELVKRSMLWEYTGGSEAARSRVQKALVELADHVNRTVVSAGVHLDDPWRDENFPSRFERRLSALVERARLHGPNERLSPAETAVLLAAPLVHEAVTALALGDLHHALETAPDQRDKHDGQVVEAMDDIRRAHRHVQEVLTTLTDRRLPSEARAAEYWLRHRFVADWDRLWSGDGSYAAIDSLVDLVSDAVAASEVRAVSFTEKARQRIGNQVRQVLGHLTVEPGERPRIGVPGPEGDWDNPFPPVRDGSWRPKQLAQLIWTAGLLAADPRRMPSVLVDHLGAHDSLQPRVVVESLTEYDLSASDDRSRETYELDIRFPCPHPALHVALEECAARVEAAVATARAKGLGNLTAGLPRRVTTRQLRPDANQYTVPIERFRLAEDEIRPLLMGHQLYGDRMLALRELYQNALDACRLRDVRNRYGLSQRRGGDEAWRGRITFVQGWDEQDRPYIECTDNGAGMSRAKLTSMFARAGKRYEQDPDYVQERREWRNVGLTPPALNSRFGIGVFSYFMLADEVEVKTAPVSRYGDYTPREQHSCADIQSGSGLLRITPSHDAPATGGTTVRLYLAVMADGEPSASLVKTMMDLLWVSDYEVVAEERDRHEPTRIANSWTWPQGDLKGRGDWFGEPAHVTGSDVWLVQGEGRLLLDGIVVKNARKVHGYVANLRERHRPEPSVDRNDLLAHDHAIVQSEVLKAVPSCVVQWKEVSLRRLWALSLEEPRLAHQVLDALPEDTMAVLEPEADDERMVWTRIPLGVSGCLPIDQIRIHRRHLPPQTLDDDRYYEENHFQQWRLRKLDVRTGTEFDDTGYPEPQALDALLFHDAPNAGLEWAPALRAAAEAQLPLRPLVKALRRYAIAGLRVPATPDIRALEAVHPTVQAADLYVLYRETLPEPDQVARHAAMVWASAKHRIPLGRCAEILTALKELDAELPAPPVLDEELHAMTVPQVVNATLNASSSMKWFPTGQLGNSTLAHIEILGRLDAKVADSASQTGKAARSLLRLAALGYQFVAVPPPGDPRWRCLSEKERLLLRASFGTVSPWSTGTMTMRQLILAAQQLNAPLGWMEQLVNEAQPLTGVQAPRVPKTAVGWTPPRWLTLKTENIPPDAPCTPWSVVLQRSMHGGGDPADIEETIARLAECDMLDGDTDATPDRESILSQAMSTELSALLNTTDYSPSFDEEGATLAFLLSLTSTGQTLQQARERLCAATRHYPLAIASLPEGTEHLSATEADLNALCGNPYVGQLQGFQESLTIQQLIEHALASRCPLGKSVSHLSAFTALGAPPPPGDFNGRDAHLLARRFPDELDLVAFDPGLLGPGVLGPLELVLVAARFGWTLAQTYDHYAPFRCLGLNVAVRRPSGGEGALRPDWRDVILLTSQLTGRAPGLCGDVPADHLTLSAEETELAHSQVRDRLESYAALFSFRLPSETEEQL